MNIIQILNENLSISDDVVGVKLPQIKLETNTGKLRGKTTLYQRVILFLLKSHLNIY
jgi:hypothetical protein